MRYPIINPDARNYLEDLTKPATCAECGKAFEIRFPSEYVYKKTSREETLYYCSYHCFRAMQKREPDSLPKGEYHLQQKADKKVKYEFPSGKRNIDDDETAKIIDMYNNGHDFFEISEAVGRSYDTVRRLLAKHGLYTPTRRQRPWYLD